jgi:hypothetical protein
VRLVRSGSVVACRREALRLSDALLDLGVLSVSVEDAQADSADEQPLYGEPLPRPIISACACL